MFGELVIPIFLISGMVIASPANVDRDHHAIKERNNDGRANCRNFYADIYAKTDANVDLISIIGGPPANQQELNELLIQTFAAGSTIQERIFTAPRTTVEGTYTLYFEYCEPKEGEPKGIYQTHHGLVGNAGYWDFHADDSTDYSFAESAAASGWATLSYDRLGVGRSSKPDGTNIVQIGYEIEQSMAIAKALREGTLGDIGSFENIVGVGHSYGSGILTGVASISPTSFDAIVLTGFSNNVTVGPLGIFSFQSTIASLAYPERFSDDANDHVTTPSATNDQFGFLHYPNYTQDALETLSATKGECTLGQQYSIGTIFFLDRSNYTSPVFVITGESDSVFCTANCYITSLPATANDTQPTQLDTSKDLFPSVTNFQTHVVPATGHGINFHTTAYGAYQKIFEFVEGLDL